MHLWFDELEEKLTLSSTMRNTTESNSHYDNLDELSSKQLLEIINREDRKVPLAIEPIIPDIAVLVDEIVLRMKEGGRLFYMGAGTSGRLGIVDASECPPTYGVPHDWVIGIIAGGDTAVRYPVEGAEDSKEQGALDLMGYSPDKNDTLIGIAASGRTPYVLGALEKANELKMLTACITCNPSSPVTLNAQHPLVAEVGPEVVTGSTRMKSGTAQKLILNMISTSVMIGLGRVKGSKMVDMQLTNEKLVQRGIRMVKEQTGTTDELAKEILLSQGSVRKAVDFYYNNYA
ncbi:MAG: N-acetylmuramic acid-6-phosphate etherase [Bacteroidota bacterium]|jgi:N-acetylmuramic acid 6-phosphate etherase